MTELEHVPTVEDLVKQNLAHPIPLTHKGEVQTYRITNEGQELIYAAQARNAEKMKADPTIHKINYRRIPNG